MGLSLLGPGSEPGTRLMEVDFTAVPGLNYRFEIGNDLESWSPASFSLNPEDPFDVASLVASEREHSVYLLMEEGRAFVRLIVSD